ncbi:hypothetical protein [Streptomyces sp. NPDC056160]|uniref:hypothetical protein n=1 Tax=Streptomyces sp. NPDC056160 TaxID=3345731 RepID=UPI0035DF29BA
MDALLSGHGALTGAPWYPARAGDRLVVTYEATDRDPRWTETYEVQDGAGGWALRLVDHTAPDDALAGWFAGSPELCGGDPFETPWVEAGPDRLAVLRDGQVVHQGRHALSRPGAADPRVTMAVGADGTTGLVVVQERQCTPAEADDLLAKVVTRAQETVRDHPRP